MLISVITGPIGFLLSYMLAWLISQFNPKLRAVFTLLLYAPEPHRHQEPVEQSVGIVAQNQLPDQVDASRHARRVKQAA